MLFEEMTEVTLIVEACRRRDVGDRVVSFGQLARGPIEAEATDVLAHRRSIVFLKRAREVCWMDSYEIRDFDQTN